jgi:arabinose-5-phosphate isomerase
MLVKSEVLKELLDKEKEYLNHFFASIDLRALEKFAETLLSCQGTIIFSGVGKSGLVAEKIAMTMTSTGTRAFFLSPTNALHGDIGILTAKDMAVMISKSGESDELLHLIPYMRNKGVKIGAIVTKISSRLAKAVDFVLPVPAEKELCPFDMAPTTSTVIQQIIGDVLAIALMQLKNFTLDEFAKNHPAGRIGRRILTRVNDLMISGAGVPLSGPDDELVNILVELSNKQCGCVLVINQQKELLGIFTDGDLRRALQKHGAKALEFTIEQMMTRSPRWIGEHELAWDALQVMEADQKRPITVLAVLDEAKKVVGIIKMHDIVQSGL